MRPTVRDLDHHRRVLACKTLGDDLHDEIVDGGARADDVPCALVPARCPGHLPPAHLAGRLVDVSAPVEPAAEVLALGRAGCVRHPLRVIEDLLRLPPRLIANDRFPLPPDRLSSVITKDLRLPHPAPLP